MLDYIIHYDVASFIITLAITLHFFYKKSIDTYQTKLFSVLIGLELVSSALDLVTMYTIGIRRCLQGRGIGSVFCLYCECGQEKETYQKV